MDAVRQLVEAGADLNKLDRFHFPAASLAKSPPMLRLLFELGANPKAGHHYSTTPIQTFLVNDDTRPLLPTYLALGLPVIHPPSVGKLLQPDHVWLYQQATDNALPSDEYELLRHPIPSCHPSFALQIACRKKWQHKPFMWFRGNPIF